MKEGIYLHVLLWSWEATMLKEIEKTREQSQRRKKKEKSETKDEQLPPFKMV